MFALRNIGINHNIQLSLTLPAGRGDEARPLGGPDPRGDVPIKKVRDIYIPDLHIDTLNVKARNFR
jgi:error-prone DNA polymerase